MTIFKPFSKDDVEEMLAKVQTSLIRTQRAQIQNLVDRSELEEAILTRV